MTGEVRKLDTLGRVVIPKSIRCFYNFGDNQSIEIFVGENGEIYLKKLETSHDFQNRKNSKDGDVIGGVRNLDGLGRIVIPVTILRRFNITSGDRVEIFVDNGIFIDNGIIVLKKIEDKCIFCGNTKKHIDYEGKKICMKCINKVLRKVLYFK